MWPKASDVVSSTAGVDDTIYRAPVGSDFDVPRAPSRFGAGRFYYREEAEDYEVQGHLQVVRWSSGHREQLPSQMNCQLAVLFSNWFII